VSSRTPADGRTPTEAIAALDRPTPPGPRCELALLTKLNALVLITLSGRCSAQNVSGFLSASHPCLPRCPTSSVSPSRSRRSPSHAPRQQPQSRPSPTTTRACPTRPTRARSEMWRMRSSRSAGSQATCASTVVSPSQRNTLSGCLPDADEVLVGSICLLSTDANRTILLNFQLPQSLLALISILHDAKRPVQDHYPLVKSSLGALLNISLDHGQFRHPLWPYLHLSADLQRLV
jgi:hypothetical protein